MTRTWIPWMVAALVGCADVAPDRDVGDGTDPFCATNRWYPDQDRDGFGDDARGQGGCESPDVGWVRTPGDCDDTDPQVHEGATELPDGVDDDCNGLVDDGTVRYDDDGDGYCEDPRGCSVQGQLPGDCDDTVATTFPGAVERCDALDNDCDGHVPSSEVDLDGDGFVACADCDEGDPTVFPGAMEACDGVDRDCDGVVDDLDVDGDGAGRCDRGAPVDVVLMVDGAEGSSADRTALAEAVPRILGALDAADRDWRIAVLEARSADLVTDVHPDLVDPGDRLVDAIEGLTAAGGPAEPTTHLADFLASTGGAWRRPAAPLAVVVVGRTDDEGAGDPARVAPGARVSVVATDWWGCTTGGDDCTPRLFRWADGTGGVAASVCDADPWGDVLMGDWLLAGVEDCDDDAPDKFPGNAEVCDGVDNDCDDAVDEDGDADGHGVCDGDCDDDDPSRHPGAVEACNGVDDDCDGTLPGAEADVDGDGVAICAGDCNDTSPGVSPKAPEQCGDGVDTNCNGVDGGPDDRVDLDGDGWTACMGDCDDDDDTTFPWAPEHAFDGADNDCDGSRDGADGGVLQAMDPRGTHIASYTFRSSASLFTLCGDPYDRVTVSTHGYALPGGGSYWDVTPSAQDMADHAPMVAMGWSRLAMRDWTGGGRFLEGYGGRAPLYISRQGGTFTVVYDGVPFANSADELTSVTTFGDDALSVALLDGSDVEDTIIGYTCDDDFPERLDPTVGAACVNVAAPTGGFAYLIDQGDLPLLATSDCAP